jgi:hypothetical protein
VKIPPRLSQSITGAASGAARAAGAVTRAALANPQQTRIILSALVTVMLIRRFLARTSKVDLHGGASQPSPAAHPTGFRGKAGDWLSQAVGRTDPVSAVGPDADRDEYQERIAAAVGANRKWVRKLEAEIATLEGPDTSWLERQKGAGKLRELKTQVSRLAQAADALAEVYQSLVPEGRATWKAESKHLLLESHLDASSEQVTTLLGMTDPRAKNAQRSLARASELLSAARSAGLPAAEVDEKLLDGAQEAFSRRVFLGLPIDEDFLSTLDLPRGALDAPQELVAYLQGAHAQAVGEPASPTALPRMEVLRRALLEDASVAIARGGGKAHHLLNAYVALGGRREDVEKLKDAQGLDQATPYPDRLRRYRAALEEFRQTDEVKSASAILTGGLTASAAPSAATALNMAGAMAGVAPYRPVDLS